jgi:hypothetical protein
MSTKAEKILALAVNFEKSATDSLVAKAKKKEEKKLDPKAKAKNSKDSKDPKESKKKDAKKPTAKKAYLEQFDSLISKFGQAPDYSKMTKDQLAGYPKPTLDYLHQWSMITPQQYTDALSTKQVFERAKPPPGTPGTPEYKANPSNFAEPSIELDDVPPKPASGIAYNKQVEIAQQQLANMGGYDLGTSGRYGNGVDGQLGQKTRDALKKFNPKATYEQAIRELVQKYNAGPEPVKSEPQASGPSVKEQYEAGTLQTIGPSTPAPTPAEQIAQK